MSADVLRNIAVGSVAASSVAITLASIYREWGPLLVALCCNVVALACLYAARKVARRENGQ